jgi:hypothetical protein
MGFRVSMSFWVSEDGEKKVEEEEEEGFWIE